MDVLSLAPPVQEMIYYGLVLLVFDYQPDYPFPRQADYQGILRLNEFLKNVSREETSEPIDQKTAGSSVGEDTKRGTEPAPDEQIGYIIRINAYNGFVGQFNSSTSGIHFDTPQDLSEDLQKLGTQICGLKVYYRPSEMLFRGETVQVATRIRPGEDVTRFLENRNKSNGPHRTTSSGQSLEWAQDRLIACEDGCYEGYILKSAPERAKYGFISRDPDSQVGVFFHFSSLDEELSAVSENIRGLKVRCILRMVARANGEQANAFEVHAAEDLNAFLARNNLKPKAESQTKEIVDEAAVDRALRNGTPAAVVQDYASNKKPLHALLALEKSKSSFTYDKYIKNKLQLLQRTKSDDTELIELLKQTVNANTDLSKKSHYLFTLGQVQFRCRQYGNVIDTMAQFWNYPPEVRQLASYNESLYLSAVSYYMMQDYTQSDDLARQVQNLGLHPNEVEKLLDRTFDVESELQQAVDPADSDIPLQFDTDIAITPFLEGLIDDFSFSNISLREIPADFDPEQDSFDYQIARTYITALERYSDRSAAGRNNPDVFLAQAKIEKFVIQRSLNGDHQDLSDEKAEHEREWEEGRMRSFLSKALQIISRQKRSQSDKDIRVYLFYKMQQFRMTVDRYKWEVFVSYLNAYYRHNRDRELRIVALRNEADYRALLLDIMLFMGSMGADSEAPVRRWCDEIGFHDDWEKYRQALCGLLQELGAGGQEETDALYPLLQAGTQIICDWVERFRNGVRSCAETGRVDELYDVLVANDVFCGLTAQEKKYIDNLEKALDAMRQSEASSQMAMKQTFLQRAKTGLEEAANQLRIDPTYILYSVFADVLEILKTGVYNQLAEATSPEPNIEASGLQLYAGLQENLHFFLPLELWNRPPANQARNLTVKVMDVSEGAVLVQHAIPADNVDENGRYSRTLEFSLGSADTQQVNIMLQIDYTFDVFDSIRRDYERRTGQKRLNFTVRFTDVPTLDNKYQKYARMQTVKDKEMFFGRDNLIQQLFSSVSEGTGSGGYCLKIGNGIVLYGQRRSGKTSILYHLKNKITRMIPNAVVSDLSSMGSYINLESGRTGDNGMNEIIPDSELQERQRKMTLGTLYHGIINGIRNYIEFQTMFDSESMKELDRRIKAYEAQSGRPFFPEDNFSDPNVNVQLLFNDFMTRFRTVARSDEDDGFRIVVFIDEFTYFNDAIREGYLPRNFMEIWKALLQSAPVTLVVAGQDNMVEFIREYVNAFMSLRTEWVSYLDEEEAYRMVTEPIGTDRIDPEAARKLCTFTACSPFLLMDVCCSLVKWINSARIVRLTGSLPDEFLTSVYMRDFQEELLEPQYKDAGRIDWTRQIKQVLGLIARNTSRGVNKDVVPWEEFESYATIQSDALEDRGIDSYRMQEILERLLSRQVIEKAVGFANRYRIKIPLCREWILRKGGAEYGNE